MDSSAFSHQLDLDDQSTPCEIQSLSKQQKPPRKFFCDFPGCGKSFTRAEHLQRHELNHRVSTNTCKRCSAHFARPDLLERHMERHAQKDKEAGGEGLGVLVTRKRCWRDENGNITTKRPASSVAAVGRALEARQRRPGDSGDESGSGSGGDGFGGTISPPYSPESFGETSRDPGNIYDGSEMLDGFEQFQHQEQLEMELRNISEDGFLDMPAPPQPGYLLDPTVADEILASCQAEFDTFFGTDAAQTFDSNTLYYTK